MTTRRARIFDLLELYGRDAPNLGDLTVRLRALNTEIRGLESQIAAIDAAAPPQADPQPAELTDLVEVSPERVNEIAPPFVMNLLRKRWRSRWRAATPLSAG